MFWGLLIEKKLHENKAWKITVRLLKSCTSRLEVAWGNSICSYSIYFGN